MKRTLNFLLLLTLIWLTSNCSTTNCDPEFIIEITQIELLKEADFKQCKSRMGGASQASFYLDDEQTRTLLSGYDFQPIRESVAPIETPFRRLNDVVEELDKMHRCDLDVGNEMRCTLILKEDNGLLIVVVSDFSNG